LIELKDADGKITTGTFDDVSEAVDAYDTARDLLRRGERVTLHRTITAVLAEAHKAK
jgi:hypothetical protein